MIIYFDLDKREFSHEKPLNFDKYKTKLVNPKLYANFMNMLLDNPYIGEESWETFFDCLLEIAPK